MFMCVVGGVAELRGQVSLHHGSWGSHLRSSGLVAGSFPAELSHLPELVFFQFLISFSFLLVALLQHSWKPPCCMRFITLQSIMQA